MKGRVVGGFCFHFFLLMIVSGASANLSSSFLNRRRGNREIADRNLDYLETACNFFCSWFIVSPRDEDAGAYEHKEHANLYASGELV
jgi:hypothetical protein